MGEVFIDVLNLNLVRRKVLWNIQLNLDWLKNQLFKVCLDGTYDHRRYTGPGVHKFHVPVCLADSFCSVAPNTCGSLVQNFLHVTFFVLRILRWLLMFGIFCTPMCWPFVSEPEQPKFISGKAWKCSLPALWIYFLFRMWFEKFNFLW